ncbi:acyltransferase [Lentimicrobium sp. S6]|uniref:acyltransferase n=1 Tax=Lentimicrobium sp. S6 TaxID=2735872 RepID=UPI0015559A49|nr:acyltransferase [Lentimicrobium sp. S6]NPD44595.1 acyltransferase [Lentimicrobium sp. S6]
MRNVFSAIKRVYLRFFASQARPIMVYYKRNFQKEKKENIRISSSTFLDYKERLKIDKEVFIGHFNFIEASNGIEIEEGVQITNYCSITTHSSHNSIRLYGEKYKDFANLVGYIKGSVFIGKYTFVGPHSVIMPKTRIGKGSLVSAYSYVQGEFPDFSIIAGNPATVIGSTKKMDQRILEQHAELKPFYEAWAND